MLEAELPGLDEKDMDLSVHDGVLTLKGEKRYEKKDEKDAARVVERHYGSFQRVFALTFSAILGFNLGFAARALFVTLTLITNAAFGIFDFARFCILQGPKTTIHLGV